MKPNRKNRNNRQADEYADKVLSGTKYIIIGFIILAFISELVFPSPVRNYGQPEKFVADEYGRKIELEARLIETYSVGGRVMNKSYSPQLYIYLYGERMKCFFHEDNMELTRTLRGYLGNKKIELSEATLAIADGQTSILKKMRIRFCSIIKIKFKDFSDVENLARADADDRIFTDEQKTNLYNKFLERYKKFFY